MPAEQLTVRTELARWIVSTRCVDLPEEVLAGARLAFINSIGTALGSASIASVARAAVGRVTTAVSSGACTVLVSGNVSPIVLVAKSRDSL